ncbi:MAG: ankyrin repeat domain-containing protein [Spirochaetales bacterium]|nr:ankyrin repeat domain-containing protein [Spirochaetales bacterium]
MKNRQIVRAAWLASLVQILPCLLFLALLGSCRAIAPSRTAPSAAAPPAVERVEPEGILAAAAAGDLDRVRALLERRPGLLEEQDAGGWDALSYAAWGAHQQVHEYLLEQGAEGNLFTEAALGPWESFRRRLDLNPIGVGSRDRREKATPLIWAARTGNQAGCEVLISRGADVSARDREGNGALHHAVMMGRPQLVDFLLVYGADIDAPNDRGRTALHLAAAEGDFEACRLLLDRGASVRAADESGNTPLHLAAERGDFELCEYLLFLGAPAGLENARGLTPRELAEAEGHEQVVELLGSRTP